MANAFLDLKPRGFNPLSASGLSAEARDGVNAALKAMSDWRNEIAATNEKSGKRVIEKMSSAAAKLGWPDQVVEAARTQLQAVAETQARALDQVMDVWEAQVKLPDPTTASPAMMLSRLQAPGIAPSGGWSGMENFQASNPLQFWLQFTEQWRKAWTDMVAKAIESGKPR